MVVRRAWLIGAVLAFLVGAMTACGEPDTSEEMGAVTARTDEPLVIGLSVALTGDATGDARRIQQGALLAVDERPAVAGHAYRVAVRDDGCDAARAVTVAQEFTAIPGLVGVVGPMCSDACVPASLIYDEADTMMLTPACTGSTLTFQGNATTFRIAWNHELQAVGCAEYAERTLGVRRVFAVNDFTFYGKTLRDSVKLNVKDRGGSLVGDEILPVDEAELTALVRAIQAARPDLVFYAGFLPAGTHFLERLRAAGVDAPFMAGDALLSDRWLAGAGALAEGVLLCDARPVQGEGFADFARRYRERWGEEPGPFSAQGYDAMTVLLRALAKTAEPHAGGVRVDRQELRDAIFKTDLRSGASGRVRFFPNGDRQKVARPVVYQVQEGRFQQVFEGKPR